MYRLLPNYLIQVNSPIFAHFSSVYCISSEVEEHLVLAWVDRAFITLSSHIFSFHFISHLGPELIKILGTSRGNFFQQ